ncbi:MAG: ATP-binding protein [Clostridia bacterium]|nr:ATP-binding protein [Clostridia bacterium]
MKENKWLEYKQDITNSFLKTVSAFANFGSGTILFGVTDDGENTGMQNPTQACLDIENKINDSISPKPDFTLNIIERTGVVALTVSKGEYTPYLYKGKAYRRSDTADIEVDRIELNRLVLSGQHQYFEKMPCEEKNLSFNYLQQVMAEKLGIAALSEDVLRTLGFMTDDRQYNKAAALFADKNNFYGVDLARFGSNINEIMDRETISHVSVLLQFQEAVKLFKKYYQYETIHGIERKTVELVPENAFREALANALVHRTWDVDAHIRVAMYSDRIELTSPGGLPSGLTEQEYLNGYISNLRNPVIGNVFFRLKLIEMFGTGIRRIKDAYSSAMQKPSFVIGEQSITVILPVISQAAKLTPEEKQLLDSLSGGMLLSSSEISRLTGFSRDKVIRIIKRLTEKNYVSVYGNGRGTKYTVNK